MSRQQTVQARRSARVSLWRTPRTRALLLVGCLSIVAGFVALAARIFTDVLWFREVSHESVYWTTLRWRALAPAVTALGTTCFILASLAIVERRSAAPPIGASRMVLALWPARRLIHVAFAIAAGAAGAEAQPDGTWKLLALWANRGDFGTSDPLFHRDAGFYVFSLPLYQQIAAWLLRTLLAASAGRLTEAAIVGHKDLDQRPAFVLPACSSRGCEVFVDERGRPFRWRVDPPESLFRALAERDLRIPRPDDGDADLLRAETIPDGVKPATARWLP